MHEYWLCSPQYKWTWGSQTGRDRRASTTKTFFWRKTFLDLYSWACWNPTVSFNHCFLCYIIVILKQVISEAGYSNIFVAKLKRTRQLWNKLNTQTWRKAQKFGTLTCRLVRVLPKIRNRLKISLWFIFLLRHNQTREIAAEREIHWSEKETRKNEVLLLFSSCWVHHLKIEQCQLLDSIPMLRWHFQGFPVHYRNC